MEDYTARSRDLVSVQRMRKPGTGDRAFRSLGQTTRSMSAFLPNRKYEHVQKIAMVVQQLKRDSHHRGNQPLAPGQKIIQGFREKIRSNFNNLYQDPDSHRRAINSQIKLLQKNKTVYTEMNNKFEHALKQKAQYDKIRHETKQLQRKLEKLRQVLAKEQAWRMESEQLKQELDQLLDFHMNGEKQKQVLDYQQAILLNMRECRRNLRNVMRQRFRSGWQYWCQINQNLNKYWNENEAKKLLLRSLELKMPSEAQMPQRLAMELETRLEEYYGKQAYLNIFQHQNILNEQSNRQEQMRLENEREAERKRKELEDRKEKKIYEQVEARVGLYKKDQEKVRKMCGVNDLGQVSAGLISDGNMSLEELKYEYEERLKEMQLNNQKLQEQIEGILSGNSQKGEGLRGLQVQYEREHEEEKKLKNQAEKCNKMLQDLMFVVERVTEEPGSKKDMNMMLASFSSKIERLVLLQKMASTADRRRENVPQTAAIKDVYKDESILDAQQEEQMEMLERGFTKHRQNKG